MAGVYDSLTRGIESGFGMGLRADEAAESKRARKFQEGRQQLQDSRADEELRLSQRRQRVSEERDDRSERRLEHQTTLQNLRTGVDAATARRKDIVDIATKRQAAGLTVPPDLAAEYGQNEKWVAHARQEAMNLVSRMTTGQVDPMSDEVTPGQLYMAMTASTGMTPAQLAGMPQHIQDVQAGVETGNEGLVLQGVNGLMAPQLQRGVGGESPHGGIVERKEIIKLVPAPGAPGKVLPVVRVHIKGGGHYDAPMTKNGTAEPNDPVVPLDIQRGFDSMGNMGVLAAAVQRPDLAEKLMKGEKEAGAQASRYLEELSALSRPAKKVLSREKVDLGDRVLDRTIDETGKVVSEQSLKKGAAPKIFSPSSGGRGGGSSGALLRAKLDALTEAHKAGELDDEEFEAGKYALLTGIKPSKAGAGKGPSNAEQTSLTHEAVNAVANELGLDYDATLKSYRNRDGSPATAAQMQKIGTAREAASKAIRDAAAEGKRTGGTAATDAAKAAVPKDPAASKFKVGQKYKDAKGRTAVYQADGTWKAD